jgi:hypothetical protein
MLVVLLADLMTVNLVELLVLMMAVYLVEMLDTMLVASSADERVYRMDVL